MKNILPFVAALLLISCQNIKPPPNVIIVFSDDMRDVDFPMQDKAQIAILYHPAKFDQNQLYNYKEDYWEQHNLVADPRNGKKVEELREQLTLIQHHFPSICRGFLKGTCFTV